MLINESPVAGTGVSGTGVKPASAVQRRGLLVPRLRRGLHLVRKGLTDLPGFAAKWAMFRCIVGHVRGRLGWPGKATGRDLTLRLGKLRMTVDPYRAEIKPYFEIWYEGSYEMLALFRPADGACVVDVGGNVGFYAVRQAERLPTGRVVVFEPSPGAFGRLKRNVEANRMTNIQLVNAAVGSSSGTVYFLEDKLSINSRVVEKGTDGAHEVPCVTLDAALAQFGIEHVDILKIDAEGAEPAVLAGAESILPHVARIVLELHGSANEEKRLIDGFLQKFGLHPVAQDGIVVYYQRGL